MIISAYNFQTSFKRLKWFGIEPLAGTKVENLVEVYGKDCNCEFDCDKVFKCTCGWNENITLHEHKSFQDLRIVSKSGIHGLAVLSICYH